jgi:exonuclease SbcD
MFAARIRRLTEAKIPTVLLTGNHDLPSIAARATAIDIYKALGIPNIFIARTIGLLRIETRSGPLQIVTLPWIPRNLVMTAEEFRGLQADEQLLRFAELIATAISETVADLDPEIPSVLLGHVSVEGARLGSEQSIMLGAEVVLTPDEIAVDSFAYVALGHIHRYQRLGAKPPVVYAGSIERVDFGEARESKGFVLVNIDRSNERKWTANWSFQPLPTRPFVSLEIEPTSDDPMEEIHALIDRRHLDIEAAIVRMNVKVSSEREDQIRVDEIRRWLMAAGASWVARVTRDVDTQSRPRVDIREEEALIPEKMLESWLELRDVPENLRARIRAAGLELIQMDKESSRSE